MAWGMRTASTVVSLLCERSSHERLTDGCQHKSVSVGKHSLQPLSSLLFARNTVTTGIATVAGPAFCCAANCCAVMIVIGCTGPWCVVATGAAAVAAADEYDENPYDPFFS